MGKAQQQWRYYERVTQLLAEDTAGGLAPAEVDELRRIHAPVNEGWQMQFFTPPPLAQFMVDFLEVEPGSTVVDPACGTGALLHPLPDCVVVGIEKMEREAHVARLLLPEARIIRADAYEAYQDLADQADYIIANPPFGLRAECDNGLGLGRKRVKSEALFTEMAVRLLKPGGKAAIIVPESVLCNDHLQCLRDWLTSMSYLVAIVSLPAGAFGHAGTGVKTSILFLRRKWAPDESPYHVFMAKCDDLGWDKRGRPTGGRDLEETLAAYRKQRPDMTLPALWTQPQIVAPVFARDNAGQYQMF